MTIFDDLAAEQERLEKILLGLDEAQWTSPSGAEGWTVADVVLHLAQSEEMVQASASHGDVRFGLGAVAGDTVDERAAEAVRAERAGPAEAVRAERAGPAEAVRAERAGPRRCSGGGSGPGGRRWPRSGAPARTSLWSGWPDR
jgi:uncharacterized protein (TIGR03083 family)